MEEGSIMYFNAITVYICIIMSDLLESIDAFERVFDCRVCFHDYDGTLRRHVSTSRHNHDCHALCSAMKRHDDDSRCTRCDARWVRQRLLSKPTPFYKRCHAGVIEAVLPILRHERLAGVMFIGLFKPPPLSAPDMILVDPDADEKTPRAPREQRLLASLPLFDLQRAGDMIALAVPLAKRLESLAASPSTADGADLSTKERIENFIDRSFKRHLYLADLAKHLGLSQSRTTQLMRAHFHKTFPELLAERRIGHAKRLLAESFLKMETIAEECGFHDVAYFFRVFKAHAQTTPARHRREAMRRSFDKLKASV